MLNRFIVSQFTLILLILLSSNAFGAQSTADVPVTEELKTQALQSILGKSAASRTSEKEYTIGHGDLLRVLIYGEGDMSAAGPQGTQAQRSPDSPRSGKGGVPVRMDGRVSLLHIGDVEAVGFTLTQLADYLKVLFATVYDDPVVTVVLEQSNSQRYTVMGKVANPGIFYLDYPIDLVQVVARCGGFTEWANFELTVVREGSDKNEFFKGNTLKFDYDDFLNGKKVEKNILIKSGDYIIAH
ncbi:MAG: polysaccharide biosynthesis/export family protein [Desulfobulbaceae bacterium]|nr:polysaccharide biosynthesis/export family protein [Desulfobulbaceae bacterium]